MNQFIQRIANYIANEVLIKGLANSRTFQRFAVRTESHLNELRNSSTEKINSHLDELHKTANQTMHGTRQSGNGPKSNSYHTSNGYGGSSSSTSNKNGPPIPPARGILGFFSAMKKEIRKDLGL